jgi:hypothetical protein
MLTAMISGDQSSRDGHPAARQADKHAASARFCLTLASFFGGLAVAVLTAALAACLLSGAKRSDTPRRPGHVTAPHSAAGARFVAAAADPNSGWYTRYTLRFDEVGGEQSVVVMAPPGGLELSVRDMTGDKVQNDIVVTPALLHWPLTVLVNDGHNHFTVAISAKFPDSSASDQNKASGTRGPVDLSALVSAGFELHALTDRGGLPVPPQHGGLLPSITIAATPLHAIDSTSGRAPPSLATTI